ncbi:hypothetical protein LTR28_003133, partial [Elasticomyces elasticus]
LSAPEGCEDDRVAAGELFGALVSEATNVVEVEATWLEPVKPVEPGEDAKEDRGAIFEALVDESVSGIETLVEALTVDVSVAKNEDCSSVDDGECPAEELEPELVAELVVTRTCVVLESEVANVAEMLGAVRLLEVEVVEIAGRVIGRVDESGGVLREEFHATVTRVQRGPNGASTKR